MLTLLPFAGGARRRKHALTLQLHTAHILSAHATLDSKNKALQDIKEQKNRCACVLAPGLMQPVRFNLAARRLESERTRLLNCLREVRRRRMVRCAMATLIWNGAARSTRIVTRLVPDLSCACLGWPDQGQ